MLAINEKTESNYKQEVDKMEKYIDILLNSYNGYFNYLTNEILFGNGIITFTD
jgi:hypothetical protein